MLRLVRTKTPSTNLFKRSRGVSLVESSYEPAFKLLLYLANGPMLQTIMFGLGHQLVAFVDALRIMLPGFNVEGNGIRGRVSRRFLTSVVNKAAASNGNNSNDQKPEKSFFQQAHDNIKVKLLR